jgi:peptidyl-prolyl cis-trans isomerase C
VKIPSISLPKKPWMRVGALLLTVAVVAGLVAIGLRQFTGLPDDAAFEYDGDVVTVAQLDDRVDALGALYGIKKPTEKGQQETFRRDVAKAVAVSMILDKAARKHDIVISDKSARDTLAAMLDAQMGPDPDAAFTEMLGEYGVSEDHVLDEIKRQQALARLFQDVTKDAVDKATPDAVRAYFDKDPSRFATPDGRRLSNIVVASRKDAVAVLARAGKGEDFGSLARQTSLDDATRDKSGDLGLVAATDLDPAFAAAAFKARSGGLFGPVKTQYGWNVGKVRKVVPGSPADLASVKAEATDALRSELALAAWRNWLTDQIKAADVEYADSYRPDHPDAPPADSGMPSTAGAAK